MYVCLAWHSILPQPVLKCWGSVVYSPLRLGFRTSLCAPTTSCDRYKADDMAQGFYEPVMEMLSLYSVATTLKLALHLCLTPSLQSKVVLQPAVRLFKSLSFLSYQGSKGC